MDVIVCPVVPVDVPLAGGYDSREQTGPFAHKPGFGTLAEGFSGLPYITGAEDRHPVLAGYPLADGVAALTGAMSVLAAVCTYAEFNALSQQYRDTPSKGDSSLG